MSTFSISARNLSKCYRLGAINHKTLADEFAYWWHSFRGRDPRVYMGPIARRSSATERRRDEAEAAGKKEFWALRDVSFDVKPGEVIGVIGRNGAGKSTLLKILTRITEPTEGDAVLEGRVASLLEVGTGFHPELTGRENVFLNGSILGMKKEEIKRKFDDIVQFAEISEFIDTPVKRYSSGMYVRLAFAVAAHLETEIILVDEVLAVGDVAFQRKCLGKMKDVAGAGRTVIFVSHSMPAIRNLCSRVLLIDQGEIIMDGPSENAITKYLDRNLIQGGVASEFQIDERVEGVLNKNLPYMKIKEIRLENVRGEVTSIFDSTQPVVVSVSFRCFQKVYDLRVVVAIADENGTAICGSQNMDDCDAAEKFYVVEVGDYTAKCSFPPNMFSNRKYYLNLDVCYPKREHHHLVKILEFQIDFAGYNNNIQHGGSDWDWMVWPKLPWSFKKLDQDEVNHQDAKC